MADASGPPAHGRTQDDASSGAQQKAQEVAGQAQEQAKEAAGRAQDMVREQVDQRSTQAGETVAGTAEDLRSVAEELRKQGKETAAKFAEQAARRSERLGSYLKESDGEKLLADVEDFGRRQPLAVLAGGLVVGMAAARFLKASSRDRYRSQSRSQEPTRELSTTSPAPPTTPVEPAGVPATQAHAAPPAPVAGR